MSLSLCSVAEPESEVSSMISWAWAAVLRVGGAAAGRALPVRGCEVVRLGREEDMLTIVLLVLMVGVLCCIVSSPSTHDEK